MRHVVAAVLAIVLGAGSAVAQTDVAFVNICRDGSLGSAAIDRIRTPALDASGLNGLGAGALRASLEQPLVDTDSADVSQAEALRKQAWDAYSAFSHHKALELLGSAKQALESFAMTSPVKAEWFDVALLEGLVQLQAKHKTEAADSFRLASRLSPGATLDPGMYAPEVIAAYQKAVGATRAAKSFRVESDASAVVWIDGTERGPAPFEGELEVGPHVVTVVAPGHKSQSRVARSADTPLVVTLDRLPDDQLIPSLRATLAQRLEPEAVATIARAAATKWLVLVRQNDDGALEGAVYDANTSELRPWVALRTVDALVGQLPKRAPDLSPKRAAELVDTPRTDVVEHRHRPWYRSPTGIAAIVGAVALVAGSVIVLAVIESDETAAIDTYCGLGVPCR